MRASATSGLLLLTALGAATAAMADGKAYVGNFKDDTVSVIDVRTATVTATVPVAAGPHGMAVSADGATVFVTGDNSSSMSVIDTATDRVTSTIDVGKSPHGVALTPDGRTLLVGAYGDDRVKLIDVGSRRVVGEVPVAKPHTIAVRPDGRAAYVASQEPGKFALVVLDLDKRAPIKSIALDKPPRDLEFGADGSSLYFTQSGINAIQVLDPATDKIVGEIVTGISPHLATVFKGASVGTAVVQGPGELMLFDPATRSKVKSVPVGKQPHWMASGDGQTILVSNEGSNDVTLVDLVTGATRTVAVGNAPRKVVVQPAPRVAGASVSIANFAFAPAEIVVAPGQRVAWMNADGAPHGIKFGDGASGIDPLLPGTQFARTFESAGTFDYVCSVHPYMTGRVVVRAP